MPPKSQSTPQKVQWYYYHDKWCLIAPTISAKLETAFQQKTPTINYQSGQWKYTADLVDLTQKNIGTGVMCEIDRVEIDPVTNYHISSLMANKLSELHSNQDFKLRDSDDDDDDDDIEQPVTYLPTQPQQPQKSTPVWEFFDQTFKQYSDSNAVEVLYQNAGQKGSVQYSTSQHSYTLDFDKMTQVNTSTQVVRNIRRTMV